MSYAITFTSKEIVQIILNKGADPNLKNKDGENALHMIIPAAMANTKGYLKVVEGLFEYGVDVNSKIMNGRSVLSEAKYWKINDLVKLLEDRGAKE